jgi:hypothetical protein
MVDTLLSRMRWRLAVVGVVLVFNFWGTLQCALHNPPGITSQFDLKTMVDHRYEADLMQFLYAQDERVGYSNYWVSYPLAFHSQEQLIFAPRLSYRPNMDYTERDDRYRRYTEIAAESPRIAYISTNNESLEEYLRREFTRLGITWNEKRIGDYQIFYSLSKVVHPVEIGLGKTTQ